MARILGKNMCNCIDKIFEHYNKEFKGGIQFTNTSQFVEMKTGKIEIRPEPLRFKRYKLGKNGEPTKKIIKSYISPNYCQFCGKAY